MEEILLHPTYLPCIAQMAAIAKAKRVVFEIEDNYQKQTYRNRAYIAHANGKLLLNIPIKHTKNGKRQKTKDVLIENDFPWQEQHWKSLQTAYRTSPFFEYYEDDLAPLYLEPATRLLSYNLKVFEIVRDLLGLDTPYDFTTEYHKEPSQRDLRYLANAKGSKKFEITPYTQVLEANHEFLHNLSVLDLLFNEGPNALAYLEAEPIKF